MNILQPHCHPRLTESFVILFCDKLGHDLYLLDDTWNEKVTYDAFFSPEDKAHHTVLKHPKVHLISYQEFLDSGLIDLVIISCRENQYDCLSNIWAIKGDKCKYATYYGNDYIQDFVPFDIIPNHIAADLGSHAEALKHGVHNVLIRPPIDYNIYTYKPTTDMNKVYCYIHNYHLAWKRSFAIYETVKGHFPNLTFKVFGKSGDETIDDPERVVEKYHESCATAHIKEREGYGFGVIESMACGRPVIAYRPFVETRMMRTWCNDETALLFSDQGEIVVKLNKYINSQTYAQKLQEKVSSVVRDMIDADREAAKIKTFLENLR